MRGDMLDGEGEDEDAREVWDNPSFGAEQRRHRLHPRFEPVWFRS